MIEFTRDKFESADGASRAALCSGLAAAIAQQLGSTPNFPDAVRALVSELRTLGHHLWSWDEDGETFEVWGPNYASPGSAGILITFWSDAAPEVVWWPQPAEDR